MNIPVNRQLFFLKQKLSGWQNTYYDATIDTKMGTDIENAKMVEEGTARMKQAIKAIAWLEAEITKLEENKDVQE